ncbi:hypothetical protein BDN70DRAFT_872243 [Pholiota conissans]|uniref:tRNA(Ile)-lysidine synthetase n=1 Tax=Pholiota conissans TaxID=109636 RepID=A0A9P5ZDL2_9AGAR|nr:hypothetical protein BDN70DRAFT_872243 [Pholiota conissans]
MAARVITPISALEFSLMMREVTPPVGWSSRLAVGNSGGPDSICLLFLLARYIKSQREGSSVQSMPKLISLSIDHDLQASSTAMANQAAMMAESIGVKHITLKLPWGQPNYLEKPGPDDNIEEKARDMRQAVLFEHMSLLGANSLALGHHIDDQVETMFMRLGRGSSQLGLAGMRPCRRWGMGSRSDIGQRYMIEGMRRWVVRPLLGVGKDRILATCEQQNLNYVTDSTNFQPHLTIRNAIRHILRRGGTSSSLLEIASLAQLKASTIQNLVEIESAASRVSGYAFGLMSALEDLRAVNKAMSTIRSNTDQAVDEIIRKHRIASPPGTFMISPLTIKAIESQPLQEALLFRITRYVSPEPWGHPQAELGRRKTSVHRLANHLCDVDSFSAKNNNSLCVGSGVWWRLVALLPRKLSLEVKDVDPWHLAWLALRQPQIRSDNNPAVHRSLEDLVPDVTKSIVQNKQLLSSQKGSPTIELLYDHRFLICFALDKIPRSTWEMLSSGNGKVLVKMAKPWMIPQVVLQINNETQILQTAVIPEHFLRHRQLGGRRPQKDLHSGWITIQYFRPSSSI